MSDHSEKSTLVTEWIARLKTDDGENLLCEHGPVGPPLRAKENREMIAPGSFQVKIGALATSAILLCVLPTPFVPSSE